jgi:hypothetical protein
MLGKNNKIYNLKDRNVTFMTGIIVDRSNITNLNAVFNEEGDSLQHSVTNL